MSDRDLQSIETPALTFDEGTLVERSRHLRSVSSQAGTRLLFALKALAYAGVLEILRPSVDGFACSSLFEAKLAREIGNGRRTIHLTTPGLRPTDMDELVEVCDYISFNSLPQWLRHRTVARGAVSCGLRVNPQVSLVDDHRCNPCRPHSKLGIPLDQLTAAFQDTPSLFEDVRGIHFHNNCDSRDLSQLLATVQHIDQRLSGLLERVEWVNLGGGYLFEESDDVAPFLDAVERLRSTYPVQLFIEPGAGLVREAGSLVSSVVDLLRSDGKTVAVLDTTINHMPELFEYQCQPDVVGAQADGRFIYTLVGGTCLAGDLFGEYAFEEPLEVGSRVVFANAGAYTLVKAHTFNGINLPTIFFRTLTGELVMQKQFTYEEFARRNGVEHHVVV